MEAFQVLKDCMRTCSNTFRFYFLDECKHFTTQDIWPNLHIRASLSCFFGWPICFVLFLQFLLFFYPQSIFLTKALFDFKDLAVWNTLGCFGLALFGVALIVPGSARFLELVRDILSSVTNLGFLMFYIEITSSLKNQIFFDLSIWNLFGVIFAHFFSILISLTLLFSTWYPLSLIGVKSIGPSSFFDKIRKTSFIFRLFVGGIVFISFTLSFYCSI